MCLTFGSWRGRLLEIHQRAWRKRKHTFIEIRSIKNPEYIHKSDKMNSQPLSDSEVSTVTSLWEISFHQPRVFLSFRERKMSFWFFFFFWRRELFSWVCVKNEVPETIMWWTFNSFPFGGIFMRVFRPGSNLRKTFVLNPEKTYSINMITAWLCDSDSAENRRVYSWKVNRDTICQRSER